MAPGPSLARSSTSTRTLSRPLSAQSTHSTDSNATQPLATAPLQHHHPLVQQQQWPPQAHPNALQYQAHQQLMAQNHNPLAMMDPGMPSFPSLQYTQANFSFGERFQSPALSSVEGDMGGTVDGNETGDVPKKRGSGASQANDQELRRLFRENNGRGLPEVASEVKREEKGPKAEKSKQVFGMLWLSQNIRKSTQSVPRNRVYSAYATRCGDDSLPLLNPASFGKLVRIIFPNIQTRRLGVRGESKYHYVNLSLVNDDGRASVPPPTANPKPEPVQAPLRIQPQLPPASDRASFFPSFDSPVRPTTSAQRRPDSGVTSLYLQHTYSTADKISIPSRKDIMGRTLRWPDESTKIAPDSNLELPRIDQYLPPGTDLDAANSLAAVYRSHCLQAIENFRYCKTKNFCDSFKSLVGLLTVPSQKLLARPELAAWIEACDRLKYQRMIPLLRNILLADVPETAMRHMHSVATDMCSWISQFFGNQPQHVLEAMLRPASAFVSLLSRFMRVNAAASNVSKIFADVDERTTLWSQWVRNSQPLQVVEGTCDPNAGGHHRLLSILTQEVSFILKPSKEASDGITDALFMDETWSGKQTRGFLDFKCREEEAESANGSGPAFFRLHRYLEDLPSRFPRVPARDVLKAMETALGIAGRNMMINESGQGWRHFWTVSVFISEMLYWQAEVGGFFDVIALQSPISNRAYTSPYETVTGMTSMPHSQGETKKSAGPTTTTPPLSHSAQAKQMHSKLLKMQENFSLPGDSTSESRGGRVSLGGETIVGDDDFQLDASMDWSMEIKDASHFFDNSDNTGVAVR